MQHINIQKPDSKLGWNILEDFCLAAAEAIKTYCGQEYGFTNENEKTRATVLLELCIDELEGLQQVYSRKRLLKIWSIIKGWKEP